MSETLKLWNKGAVPFDYFPKTHRISKDGSVFRWDKKCEKWVKLETLRDDDGIYVNIDKSWWNLAREVADHFVPNPDNFGAVGYKDGDLYNCNAENLFWTDGITSSTYREGVIGDKFYIDPKQGHFQKIVNGNKTCAIYPVDYEFMPELDKWYKIYPSKTSLKLIDIEKDTSAPLGMIRFPKETYMGTVYHDYRFPTYPNWVRNGMELHYDNKGEMWFMERYGRCYSGERGYEKVRDNLMRAMFGCIPRQVVILKLEFKEIGE